MLEWMLSYVRIEDVLMASGESIVQLSSISGNVPPQFSAAWTLGRDGDRDMIGLALITIKVKR